MRDKQFLDTNILLYSLDLRDLRKHDVASRITRESVSLGGGVISNQVASEFANNLLRKFSRTPAQVLEHCLALRDFEVHENSLSTIEFAVQLLFEHQLSFWDACIVAAALESGCSRLVTEDMQHGRTIGPLLIVNPFVS
jgi:predicted nucleic acid-binding protein